MCYRKGGYLAITDANLLLGRILPAFFPNIFGEHEDEPLDEAAARCARHAGRSYRGHSARVTIVCWRLAPALPTTRPCMHLC